jgi:hypothetical protein
MVHSLLYSSLVHQPSELHRSSHRLLQIHGIKPCPSLFLQT